MRTARGCVLLVAAVAAGCAMRAPLPPPEPGVALPVPGRSAEADELVYGRLHPELAFPAGVRRWPARRLVLRLCEVDLGVLAAQLTAMSDESFAPVEWYVQQMVAAARRMFADVLGPEAVVDAELHPAPACPPGPLVVRVRFAPHEYHLAPLCAQTLLPASDRRSIIMRADRASADRCLVRGVFPALFAHEFAHALGLFHTQMADALMRSVLDLGRAPRLSPRERYWAQRLYAAADSPVSAEAPVLAVDTRRPLSPSGAR